MYLQMFYFQNRVFFYLKCLPNFFDSVFAIDCNDSMCIECCVCFGNTILNNNYEKQKSVKTFYNVKQI